MGLIATLGGRANPPSIRRALLTVTGAANPNDSLSGAFGQGENPTDVLWVRIAEAAAAGPRAGPAAWTCR